MKIELNSYLEQILLTIANGYLEIKKFKLLTY